MMYAWVPQGLQKTVSQETDVGMVTFDIHEAPTLQRNRVVK